MAEPTMPPPNLPAAYQPPPMSSAVAAQATADAVAKDAAKGSAKRMKLAERRAERAKVLGGRYLEVEGEDGTVVAVPRIAFWDAKTYESWVKDTGGFRTDLETL